MLGHSIVIRVVHSFTTQMSSRSAQLQLPPSPSLQPSISHENGDFDPDAYLRAIDASEMLENDRMLLIYYFGRDAADNVAAEAGDFGGGAGEDEAAEDEVDGAIVNCDIQNPPVDQHYNNLEVALQMIQGFTKEHGYALTTLRSKIKDGEVYKVYPQCNSGKSRSPFGVAEHNRQRMNGTRCRNLPLLRNVTTLKRIWCLGLANPQQRK
jgi:hypothetical protein